MIKLNRKVDRRLSKKYWGPKKTEWELKLLQNQRSFLKGEIEAKARFKSSFWSSAKKRLKKESNNKCAYCECDFEVVAYGDVEHFRPKSIYWWLAYSYNNYAASCQICNQSFKSNHFPIDNPILTEPNVTAQSTDAELQALAGTLDIDLVNATQQDLDTFKVLDASEKALLMHPYLYNFKDFFAYEFDGVKKEITVIALNENCQPFVKAAEEFLGINRPTLKRKRFKDSLQYWNLKTIIADTTIPDNHNSKKIAVILIKSLLSGEWEFTGMYEYFENNTPNPLPDLLNIL